MPGTKNANESWKSSLSENLKNSGDTQSAVVFKMLERSTEYCSTSARLLMSRRNRCARTGATVLTRIRGQQPVRGVFYQSLTLSLRKQSNSGKPTPRQNLEYCMGRPASGRKSVCRRIYRRYVVSAGMYMGQALTGAPRR